MRPITKTQFDAYCFARHPVLRIMSREIAWFEAADRKLLAVITQDRTDRDYGYVILGRDAKKMFRAIGLSKEFVPTVDEAAARLTVDIAEFVADGQELYPQGDERRLPNEILEPQVSEEKLHPYFIVLAREPRFEAARNLIKEIVYSYTDPDGHYIREFQTQGFDARLWELYLYTYFHSAGLDLIRGNPSPDFHLSYFGEECFVEAVTVNPTQNPAAHVPPPEDHGEVMALTDDYLPIKFGSALYSKLQKRYWEKDHVAGKPLIIAIHDFHMPGSMTWSRTALSEYLYGIRTRLEQRDGKEVAVSEPIERHIWQGKEIPSNFFALPEAENISGVLFSNAATITKFNRMGKLAGLGSKEVVMLRHGFAFDPDPSALRPMRFVKNVDDADYEESWSDSLMLYHNPRAKHPVDPAWFGDISHMIYDLESREFRGISRPFDVLASTTLTLSSHPGSGTPVPDGSGEA